MAREVRRADTGMFLLRPTPAWLWPRKGVARITFHPRLRTAVSELATQRGGARDRSHRFSYRWRSHSPCLRLRNCTLPIDRTSGVTEYGFPVCKSRFFDRPSRPTSDQIPASSDQLPTKTDHLSFLKMCLRGAGLLVGAFTAQSKRRRRRCSSSSLHRCKPRKSNHLPQACLSH